MPGRRTKSPPLDIFLNYRRDDSDHAAGRLHDRLCFEYGESHVFMDVDAIGAGVDFTVLVKNAVAASDVLIALIGRHWLDARDADGLRRLEDKADYVRVELETAIAEGVPVLPVLLGVDMPQATGLPKSLNSLPRIHAHQLRHATWPGDADGLVRRLEEIRREKAARQRAARAAGQAIGETGAERVKDAAPEGVPSAPAKEPAHAKAMKRQLEREVKLREREAQARLKAEAKANEAKAREREAQARLKAEAKEREREAKEREYQEVRDRQAKEQARKSWNDNTGSVASFLGVGACLGVLFLTSLGFLLALLIGAGAAALVYAAGWILGEMLID